MGDAMHIAHEVEQHLSTTGTSPELREEKSSKPDQNNCFDWFLIISLLNHIWKAMTVLQEKLKNETFNFELQKLSQILYGKSIRAKAITMAHLSSS